MNDSATFQVTAEGDREIRVIRSFAAPRDLVFDCFTQPELVRRWMFGPPGWTFAVCEIDLRVGGAYRFVWRGPEGVEMGMGGVHREIVRPERVVQTQLFDGGLMGAEAVGTLVLTEQGGKTLSTNTIRYASRADRDGALQSGMEHGHGGGLRPPRDVLASMPRADLHPSQPTNHHEEIQIMIDTPQVPRAPPSRPPSSTSRFRAPRSRKSWARGSAN